MHRDMMTPMFVMIIFNLSFLLMLRAEMIPICEILKDNKGYDDNSLLKLRRVRALCDALQSSQSMADREDADSIPDFDLKQIDTENDANQILKRFRRGRGGGGGGRGGGGGGGSRSSSSGSRSSSSGGSRFFGGSRSSSSSGSSRVFSRSSSSSSGSGSRIFSRGGSSSGGGTSGSSSHRVREAVRSVIRKPTSSGSGGLPGSSGSKPGLSDKIRKMTHGTGGGGIGGGSRIGMGGGGGGSSGTGGNVWVRAGKTFLPHAVRYGKRYYQRRKYNKGMYAGMGGATGYYAGSRMNDHHHGSQYPYDNYGYPPGGDQPTEVNGKTPTIFYCLQEDLNSTLVNKTLDAEGFGTCNVSGKLVTCPIEIECKTSEADNCCEDEQGTPYCCGGPIPVEYISQYGGYGDDWGDASESIHKILNIMTAICIMMATICFTIWQRRE